MVNGYIFVDCNSNGEFDFYEDDCLLLEIWVDDFLDKMIIEEKIYLFKGLGMVFGFGLIEVGDGIFGVVGIIVLMLCLGFFIFYLFDGFVGLRI